MDLFLSDIEIPVLLLSMKISRKNVKKGFKANYGGKDGKEILKDYDDIISLLESNLEPLDNVEIREFFSLEDSKLNVLYSFLSWYVPEVEKAFRKAKKKISGEDQEQISTLKGLINKIDLGLKYA